MLDRSHAALGANEDAIKLRLGEGSEHPASKLTVKQSETSPLVR